MKRIYALLCFYHVLSLYYMRNHYDPSKENPRQKTTFQTAHVWIPEIDVRSDAAIVYGVSERNQETFENV